jgi:hypothetical protein
MTWNHRVIRFKDDDVEGGYRYELKEVFYRDGTPTGYADPYMWSEGIDGLQELVDQLLRAVTQPALDESDFGDLEASDENYNA